MSWKHLHLYHVHVFFSSPDSIASHFIICEISVVFLVWSILSGLRLENTPAL